MTNTEIAEAMTLRRQNEPYTPATFEDALYDAASTIYVCYNEMQVYDRQNTVFELLITTTSPTAYAALPLPSLQYSVKLLAGACEF